MAKIIAAGTDVLQRDPLNSVMTLLSGSHCSTSVSASMIADDTFNSLSRTCVISLSWFIPTGDARTYIRYGEVTLSREMRYDRANQALPGIYAVLY